MTRLFKLAAGRGLTSSRYARLGQAPTGDLQKRRYTNFTERARNIRCQGNAFRKLLRAYAYEGLAGLAAGVWTTYGREDVAAKEAEHPVRIPI
jgi:hypothetical protein